MKIFSSGLFRFILAETAIYRYIQSPKILRTTFLNDRPSSAVLPVACFLFPENTLFFFPI